MQSPTRVTHLQQETGYSCAAACLSMVLGIPEREARKAAHTTRVGTYMEDLSKAATALGAKAHMVRVPHLDYNNCLWWLEAQSQRWPLILSCGFRQSASDSIGRKRTHRRQHAVVLWKGQVYDPGEPFPLDSECLGHLGDKGIHLDSYLLIEYIP